MEREVDGGTWRRRTTPEEGVCGGGRRGSGSMAGFLVNKWKVMGGETRKVSLRISYKGVRVLPTLSSWAGPSHDGLALTVFLLIFIFLYMCV